MSAAAVYYDPFDPVVMADPYPTYQALRKAAPVYWSDAGRCWVLSRHSDVTSALHDPSTFSSASGVFPTVGAPSMADLFLPMLIMTDPPRHTAMRRIVSRAFTPRRIATLEAGIQELIEGLLDDASSHETWDAVEALTAPLPAIVIADLLGVPREDRDSFRRWSTQLIQSQPQSPRIGGALEAAAALYDYFASFLAERRIRPRDDLMSALVEAEVEGQRLSEDELLGFCFLLLVAGHETTTNLLSNSLVALAGEPDARHAMADDPQLLPRAVEELPTPPHGRCAGMPSRSSCATTLQSRDFPGRSRARPPCTGRTWSQATWCFCCSGPPIATSRFFPPPTDSTSIAALNSTLLSDTASTSA